MEKDTKITENTAKEQKPWLFKKGESGNPAGRPLGSKNFETDFDEAVEEIAKENKMTRSEARKLLLKVAFKNAKEGNYSFYKDIHDRIYGTATNKTDITTSGREITVSSDELKALAQRLNNLENEQTNPKTTELLK